MQQILSIVLPVFGLVGIGYALAATKLLGEAVGDGLSEFVFVVAIPLLILHIVATADLGGISAWRLWFSFFGAFAISWALGSILTRRIFGHDARAGLVAGLSAGYGNTTLIGIPLALAAFGVEGSVPMALIIAVQLPVMMTAVALLMVRAERLDGVTRSGGSARAIVESISRNLVTNPIIIGLAAGLAWRVSGIPFGGLPGDLVTRLAAVASPLALFAMGMSLRKYGIGGHISPALILGVLKLIVMPGLVLVIAQLVGLPAIPTKVAVIAAACPTGVTPFLIAGRFNTGEGLASNTIMLSTLAAVASVGLWLNIVALI
jgi:predicted permease